MPDEGNVKMGLDMSKEQQGEVLTKGRNGMKDVTKGNWAVKGGYIGEWKVPKRML